MAAGRFASRFQAVEARVPFQKDLTMPGSIVSQTVMAPPGSPGREDSGRRHHPGAMAHTRWGTVLIVDDDHVLRSVLSQALVQAGFEVVEARDGKEALRQAHENPPDVILSDILMDRSSGLELYDECQALANTRDVPFVLMTGVGNRSCQWKVSPTVRYLVKPFSVSAVVQTLCEVVEAHRTSKNGVNKPAARAGGPAPKP